MKTINLILIQILFANFILTAQYNPTIVWQKSLGGSDNDYAYSIQQTSDNGYIVAGRTISTNGDVNGNYGDYDYWIVKLNDIGDTLWTKHLGGSNYEIASSIQQTINGNYIIAGATRSNDIDVNGNHGNADYWIVKISSTGNAIWQKCFGGTNNDAAYSIQQTTDSGYVVTGNTSSNNGDVSGFNGNGDYWVLKLNTFGDTLWTKCLGGTDWDNAQSIQQTSDGGYVLAGYTESNNGDVYGNHGGKDIWVVKLNVFGDTLWTGCYGGTDDEEAYAIQQTIDGGYIIAGWTGSNDGNVSGNHGGSDYWIVKIDSVGNIIWQKCFGGTNYEDAHTIRQTFDGGYIIGGKTSSTNGDVSGNYGNNDYWVVKIDSLGNIMWTKCLGGSSDDEIRSIQQTTDGGYIIAGYSQSTDGDVTGNHGSNDYWIVKLKIINLNITQANISCYGFADGSITVTPQGGIPPYTYQWNTGDTTQTITNLPAGIYSVTVTDVNGEAAIENIEITQPDSLYLTINNGGCNGYGNYMATVSVTGGTQPYIYQWSNGDTDSILNATGAGTYYILVTDSNNCQITDSTSLYDAFSTVLTPTAISCFEDNGSITASVSGGALPYTYQWSNGDTTLNINDVSAGNHFLTVTDNNGCQTVDSTFVDSFFVDLSICLVTVDTITGKSFIVWERPANTNIVAFNVRRETGVNVYDMVGTVPWDSMTVYLDTTSNPSAYAQSYKIAAVDTCGNEGPLSFYHKTMYLGVSQGFPGIVLDWTPYEDESGNFQPVRYYIYRYNELAGGGYVLLDSIPANITNYNDDNAPAGINHYLVLTHHDSCIPSDNSKVNGGPFVQSISNLDDYSVNTFWGNIQFTSGISIFPNPNTGSFTITGENIQRIEVVNVNGQVVFSKIPEIPATTHPTTVTGLDKGIYFVKVVANQGITIEKCVVE